MISKRTLSLLKPRNCPFSIFTVSKWTFAVQIHYARQSSKPVTSLRFHQSALPYHTTPCVPDALEIQKLNEPLLEKQSKVPLLVAKRCEQASEVQNRFIVNFIVNKDQASNDDWNGLLKDIFALRYGGLNMNTIHGKIMEICGQYCNLNLAKSYLRFMKDNGKKFNQAVVIEFINICYNCRSSLTEADLKSVEYFTNYLSKCSLMENKLGGAVVNGLSLMNDWKRCLEIVNDLEKNVPVMKQTYSSLIICLLHNHKFELARSKLLECLNHECRLFDTIYLKWIDMYHRDSAKLQELLSIFRDHNVIPKKEVCTRLIEVFSQLPPERRLHGAFTRIHHYGQCECCKEKLVNNMFSHDEFCELQEAFLNRVLVGSDVFRNTTPDELQTFFDFVKLQAPFDVVIDGLNMIYRKGTQIPGLEKASLLLDAVNYFYRKDKKVLIVGKKHMKKLPPKILENVYEKSAVFLTDDLSEDDPFIIYATLYSGRHCIYVTKDYLRSEKCRLSDTRLKDLFKRWQLSHQRAPKILGGLTFRLPLSFRINVQSSSPRSWHVPYYEGSSGRSDFYDNTNTTNWLCLHR